MQKSVLLIIFLGILAPFAYGLGIASDYFPDDTIPLAPGANFEYRINIQNGGGETVNAEVLVGDPNKIISSNTSALTIELPGRTYDKWIPLNISIPWYAKEGTIYSISYQVAPASGSGGGGVPFTFSLSRAFKVNVTETGFISRGVRAKKRGFIDITAQAVKDTAKRVYANKADVGLAILVIGLIGFITVLVWKRSGLIVEKLTRLTSPDEQPFDMSYSTLPEFYRVMTSVDGKTFYNYINFYNKEIYAWIYSITGDECARWLMSSATRKEFLQRLKNGLRR